jgi:type IV secretory pathway VirB10-like protein
MVTTRIGLAVLGTSCLVAAGAGGFLATRYNAAPAPQAAVARPAERGPEGANPAASAQPVQETEAVMDEAPAPTGTGSATTPAVSAPAVSAPDAADKRAPREQHRNQQKTAASGDRRVAARERVAPAAPRTAPSPRGAESAAPSRAQAPAAPVGSAADKPVGGDSRTNAGASEQSEARSYETARRVEPVEQPKWQEPRLEELVVPADSVIGLQVKNTVSSETSQVEDRVEAQVVRDVAVSGRVAIPAGSRVLGAVTAVERGGKVRDRARLGVRFHTLVLGDGTTLPLQTDTVYRDGDSPSRSSAAKMGGAAIGGAIVGAILGGGKGAVIGGATGAAGGTAAVMAGSRRAATMASGSTVTVRVLSPVAVTVER